MNCTINRHDVCSFVRIESCRKHPLLVQRGPDTTKLILEIKKHRHIPLTVWQVLTTERHLVCYAPDGWLMVAFRNQAKGLATKGSWVGTYDDIIQGRKWQYRVRLRHQYGSSSFDWGYSGLKYLPTAPLTSNTGRPPKKTRLSACRSKNNESDVKISGS